eukprot:2062207-Amphidinium_carterae.1
MPWAAARARCATRRAGAATTRARWVKDRLGPICTVVGYLAEETDMLQSTEELSQCHCAATPHDITTPNRSAKCMDLRLR